MRTRSQSRENFPRQEASSAIVDPHRIENPFLEDQFQEDTKDPPVVTMADNRTMAEMLRAPTEGYAEAIVVPSILAEQFEVKHSLINMMTSKQFFGLEKDNPHDHIRAARRWLEKEPPCSITTWEDLVSKFINEFFPPSRTTSLRNEISNFEQKFGESFHEAWERYKDLLRVCPHHSFTELHQLNTFYNALNPTYQDSLNAAAGGNLKLVLPVEVLIRIINVLPLVATLSLNIRTTSKNTLQQPQPTTIRMNTASSSSGTLPSNTVANPKSDLKAITTQNGVSYDGPSKSSPVVENAPEATKDTVIPTNNGNTKDVQPQAVSSKPPVSTSEPANTPVSASKPNPQASIPYPSRRNDERNREKAKDQIEKFYQIFKDMRMVECLALADLGASINLMPYSVWKKLSLPDLTPTCMTLELADRLISRPVGVAEDVYVKVGSFHFPADFVVVDFDADPRVPLILERLFLKTGKALIDVFEGELTLRVSKEAITFNLDQTSRYFTNYNDMTAKIINVIDMACEEYSQEVLGFFDTASSGNPTPLSDPIVSATSPTLTPFGETKTEKSLVDEPPVVELKALPPHLEYAFLEGDNKLPVIIAKDLSVEGKATLITVLKSQKRAIAWKISDIKGINPEFCSHKILLEEDFKPAVQQQRRVNPKIHDVIKQEVIKLLDAGLIYPVSDSSWVSPVHCVPKKGGFTVVENEENELIPLRLVTGWRVCIDYRKFSFRLSDLSEGNSELVDSRAY
nr:hypothetical protein [Tanacetum cinerariifolium]